MQNLHLFALRKGINLRARGQNLRLSHLNKGTKSSANQTLLNPTVSGHWSKGWVSILYLRLSGLHHVATSPVLTGVKAVCWAGWAGGPSLPVWVISRQG